jgi:iodotyrosine deiodinase
MTYNPSVHLRRRVLEGNGMTNAQEPLRGYEPLSPERMMKRTTDFYVEIRRRRSVRDFSGRDVPRSVIETCLRAAGTAPNGANLQPWHFVAVQDAEIKHQIRVAAEAEEREFYARRAPQEWLDALAPLGTDASKPFLETAPYLIAIFAQPYGIAPDGRKVKHYYVSESVGIATGFLIAALHHAGLATLTHTPSPMNFLNQILERPEHERPFLLLVVGYAAEDARVPVIKKKPLAEIATFV